MPIYVFECGFCGEVVEKYVLSHKENDPNCEVCSMRMKKKIAPVYFKFKGEPPRSWKPLKKSKPKSYVPTKHDLKHNK